MDFATLMSRMLDGEHDLGIIGSGGTLDPSESRENDLSGKLLQLLPASGYRAF